MFVTWFVYRLYWFLKYLIAMLLFVLPVFVLGSYKTDNIVETLLANGFELENIRISVGPNAFSPDGNRIVFTYQKYNDKIKDQGIFIRENPYTEKDYFTNIHNPPKNLEYNGLAIYDLVLEKVIYNYRLPNALYIEEPSFNKTGTHVAFVIDKGMFFTGTKKYGSLFWIKEKYIWYAERLLPPQDLYVLNIEKSEMQKYSITKTDEMPFVWHAVPSPSGNKIAFMPYVHRSGHPETNGFLGTMIWELHLSDNMLKPIVPRSLIDTPNSTVEQNHFLYIDENTIRTLVYYAIHEHNYACDFNTMYIMKQNIINCMYKSPISLLSKYMDDTDEKYFSHLYAQFSFDGNYVVANALWRIRKRPSYKILRDLDATAMMISFENLKKYDVDRIPKDEVIPFCLSRCEQDIYGNNQLRMHGEAFYTDKVLGVVWTDMHFIDDDEILQQKIQQYGAYINRVLSMQVNDSNKVYYLPLGYSRNWVQTSYTVKNMQPITLPEIGYKWSMGSYEDIDNLDPNTLEYIEKQ